MKRLICALTLGGLISTGCSAPTPGKIEQLTSTTSINEILRAHNVPRDYNALRTHFAEAVKLVSYHSSPSSEAPNFFELNVSVSSDGKAFKRRKADPMGLIEESVLFDGRTAYRIFSERGKKLKKVSQMSGSQFGGVEFSVRMFGLVSILKQLSDSATETVYLGRTKQGKDKLEVKTTTTSWTLYSDSSHMICRIEIGDKTIEYSDYRTVEGVQLPFIQRLSVGGKLMYELAFNRIDLDPVFPIGYFSREALLRKNVR